MGAGAKCGVEGVLSADTWEEVGNKLKANACRVRLQVWSPQPACRARPHGKGETMACKYICDGCGKEAKATSSEYSGYDKPHSWFQRRDKDGAQDACSRECIEKIAKESGKTACVLPF